jgi:outer membrane lipase/esterase
MEIAMLKSIMSAAAVKNTQHVKRTLRKPSAAASLENAATYCRQVFTGVMLAFVSVALPLAAFAQVAAPPAVSQITFSPATISSGGTSQLSIVFSNPNGTATLTNPLIDSLPAGLTVSATGSAGNCPNAAVANAGSGSVTYPAGAVISTGGCTITVTVKATTASNSYFTDTIPAGALNTNFGASLSGASGTLTVRAAVIVPNLVGLSQAAAATALQAVGLTLGAVSHSTSPCPPPSTNACVPYNSIISQSVPAKTSVSAGTAVNIVVSTGANPGVNPNDPLASSSIVNPKQVSVASAVDRVCANLQRPGVTLTASQKNLLANCTAIVNTYSGSSNSAGLQGALSAVSGKQTTAQQRTGIEFSGTQFQNIASRLTQLRQGASGFSLADLNTGGVPLPGDFGQLIAMLKDPSNSDPKSNSPGSPVTGGGAGDSPTGGQSRWGFFINGGLRRGTQDATDYESGFDFKSNGVTAGVDYRFTDHLVFGIAAGHSSGHAGFSDGSGRIDSKGNTGSLYGTYYNGPFYLDAIGTFGHIDYDEFRTTTYNVAAGTTGTASNCNGTVCTINTNGSTGARELSFGGSTGYTLHTGGLLGGPDIALDWTRVDVNGFSENDPGNTGMALAYGSQIGESLLLKAGGHLSYALSTPIAVFLPQVRAHYIHEFKNNQRALTANYVQDPTVNSVSGPISSFVLFTDRPDRNYADWAASITAQFPFGLSAFVDYSALAGYSQLQTHEFTFGIRLQAVVR